MTMRMDLRYTYTISRISFNPIYPGLYENLFTLGGDMAPMPKIPGRCPLSIKFSRVPQGGLNITFGFDKTVIIFDRSMEMPQIFPETSATKYN